jgi:hypothetical protein
MGCCPGPSPLKRAQDPNLPSSEIGEAGALCAGAHHTPSDLSIEYAVQGCQPGTEVTTATINRLADALGVPPSHLLEDAPDE